MPIRSTQRSLPLSRLHRHGSQGHNAIVLVYDENDYSYAPNTNQVLTTVYTNYGFHKLQSSVYYTHFSLVKTLDQAFGLPCLNHACASNVNVMSDLFGQP